VSSFGGPGALDHPLTARATTTSERAHERRYNLGDMTAQIGADGLDLLGDPLLELLTDVARVQPEPGRDWVHLEDRLGFRSTQRLRIGGLAGSVVVGTWPAELAPQARYLYGNGLGSALVAAANERGWIVEPSPHIAYRTSSPSRRLYMSPSIEPLDYVARWEDKDALSRIGGNYTREAVEHELWPWLKRQGFADDSDDAELLRFLDRFLGDWPANMRPGLRFRRDWTFAEEAELGSALAETIRSDFDAVFAVAHEPTLSSVERSASPGLGAPYRQVPVIELSRNRDPFSVDPALAERGLRGHTDTQNELASVLDNAGIEPRRGLPPGPNFDLAWQKDGTVFVAEVKSITAENEEHQLRVGLGQVLRYRQQLFALGHHRVVAVLVPERQPRDPSWRELCQEVEVVLLCRNELERAPTLKALVRPDRTVDLLPTIWGHKDP
jgi:hypothetical protein